MPAKDLGTKYTCFKCAAKFYDLKKPDPICPKCGADQRQSPALKPPGEGRRSRLAPVPKAVEPIEPDEVAESVVGDEDENLEDELDDEDDVDVPTDDEEEF